MAIRADRAVRLVTLYQDGDYDAIRFMQADGSVHVVAHREDWPKAHDDVDPDGFLSWALGDTWSVCGIRLSLNRGGLEQSGRHVVGFADDLLCFNCHRAFGDDAVLLFEANPQDTDEPETMPIIGPRHSPV